MRCKFLLSKNRILDKRANVVKVRKPGFIVYQLSIRKTKVKLDKLILKRHHRYQNHLDYFLWTDELF